MKDEVPYYEVVDADSIDDAFPPRPWKVVAKVMSHGDWAISVEDAAEQWADAHHADHDYPEEMRCVVTDPTGQRWDVTVSVETVAAFHGTARVKS